MGRNDQWPISFSFSFAYFICQKDSVCYIKSYFVLFKAERTSEICWGLLGTPVHLPVHEVIQSANHVEVAPCINVISKVMSDRLVEVFQKPLISYYLHNLDSMVQKTKNIEWKKHCNHISIIIMIILVLIIFISTYNTSCSVFILESEQIIFHGFCYTYNIIYCYYFSIICLKSA